MVLNEDTLTDLSPASNFCFANNSVYKYPALYEMKNGLEAILGATLGDRFRCCSDGNRRGVN